MIVKDAQTCLQKNYLDKTIREGEARVGESLCWKWVAAPQAQDAYQNKICKQYHYVWRMYWSKKNHHYLLW